ncbi:GAF domain-containing protein, partial [Mastigocoleus sp. MO_188.B34]|uniref:GAF domain-containing protein n=1 Tax=Mastigocoleus sp. MO_188.B34 TaxID=3036635 RepID=UPI0026318ABB
RDWQEHEINWFSQVATQIGFAIENAKLNAKTSDLRHEKDIEAEWTKYFTQTVRLIRASLKEEDIFKTSVEEVRRVIGCDRVVVYGLNAEYQGVIVAESVVPGLTRGLGATIKDPCFEAQYIEKYENGRVRAIDNIYEAGLSVCYISQLEKLAVKANLVAPIINEGKLLGLLVAHQCSQPYHWQQYEIRWVSQIAMQVGFAIDNAKLIATTSDICQQTDIETEWTSYFTQTVKLIRDSLNKEDILKTSVEEVRRVVGCDRVVVYGLDSESMGIVTAESVGPRWSKSLGAIIEDPCFAARYLEQYQNGRIIAISNIYEASLTPCYIEQLERFEVKANLVAPIIHEGKLMGLLIAHECSQAREWLPHEVRWFSQIATQIGFALENAELFAKTSLLRQEKNVEDEWTKYFTQTVRLIRSSLKEEDILKTTVEEVRRVIECDSVLVYGLKPEDQGVVIAESVGRRWTRALGMTMKDPCLEAKYIEKYRNGRVKVTNNIYEAGFTACYIEQLEKIDIKANIITPIINEDKLLGLLVANQCSGPREWLSHEVRWLSQIAMQVGFALENAQVSESRIQTYQVLKKDAPIQHSQQEDFQELIAELLKDNENSFKAFSSKALNLSEFVTVALKQIQGVSDGAKGVATTARQAEHQVKRNHQSLQEAQKNVKNILQSISAHHEAVVYGAQKVKQVSEDCHKLSALINEVSTKLNKQINSQNINAAIAKSELENSEQELLVSGAEEVESTEKQLIETVTQTQSLLTSVTKEIHQISGTMETGSQQTSTWTKSLKNNELQIYHISTINTRAGRLVEKITQAATNQIRSSDEARQHILSASTVARKISEQSQALTKWFTQLSTFAQDNIQKAEFWENIKRFLHSSHTLVTGLTEKK